MPLRILRTYYRTGLLLTWSFKVNHTKKGVETNTSQLFYHLTQTSLNGVGLNTIVVYSIRFGVADTQYGQQALLFCQQALLFLIRQSNVALKKHPNPTIPILMSHIQVSTQAKISNAQLFWDCELPLIQWIWMHYLNYFSKFVFHVMAINALICTLQKSCSPMYICKLFMYIWSV